jgi:membrane-associated phospholipid phosphatase
MENILQWGLTVIGAVQAVSNPPLTAFMKIVTNLGSASAYMVLLPFIYWCIDEKKGLRLGLAVIISSWINITLKFLFAQPRPFWDAYDPGVGIITESLYGFPSGHAQISLVMWIIIASWGKKKWLYCAAILLNVLIAFSRVYLGVHFPTDIAGGWILGVIFLAVYFPLSGRIDALLRRGGMRFQITVSAAAAFIMILYRPIEADNMEGAVQALLMPGAAVCGIGIGYGLSSRYLHFHAASVFGRKGAAKFFTFFGRFIIGVTGIVLLFIIFRFITRILSGDLYRLGIFSQFVVLELWIFTGAPWMFQKLKLAEKNSAPDL